MMPSAEIAGVDARARRAEVRKNINHLWSAARAKSITTTVMKSRL